MVLALLTVPPVIYAILAWPNDEKLMLPVRKQSLIRQSIVVYICATAIKTFVILLFVAMTDSERGYERLLAFVIGQAFWALPLYMALACIRTRTKSRKA